MNGNMDVLHNYFVDLSEKELADYILTLSDGYKTRWLENRLYNEDDQIPENIICLYLYFIDKMSSKNFQLIVADYKREFRINESRLEAGGNTSNETQGLDSIYDYIGQYDFSKKKPNIFLEGMKIHALLYSHCPHPEYGGKLRMEPVRLNNVDYEVPDAADARAEFQNYIMATPSFERKDLFAYLDKCIHSIVKLIGMQPFPDGNKRTFRAVLNLMFAQVGIPPVYIREDEREVYKEELMKAIKTGDFHGITRFYYYKICDAIVDLNLEKFRLLADDEVAVDNKFVIVPKNKF